jgi:hypothetical protein
MRNDIDYVDCDGEGLVYDNDWITPKYSKGHRKLRLTNSISIYYRMEGHFIRFDIVLSFDSLGTHAPRSLPILFYGFLNMLDIWEKLGSESEEDSE